MALIELKGIEKHYDDGTRVRKVLSGLDLTVEKGDMISVSGVSGSGKTTLLSVLGTILRPDAGTYLLDGTDVLEEGVDLGMLRNRKIGFMFQDHRLIPQYTAWENILLPCLASSDRTSAEDEAYARSLMEMLGVLALADQYPSTLSGGESSRVALCRALVRKPELILADEPTGQLDSDHAEQVAELLQKINRELGTAVIVVTHSDRLASMAPKRYSFKEGRLYEL